MVAHAVGRRPRQIGRRPPPCELLPILDVEFAAIDRARALRELSPATSCLQAFALGIQCVLKKDWDGLVRAFVATGFVGNPMQFRESKKEPFGEGDADTLVRCWHYPPARARAWPACWPSSGFPWSRRASSR